MQDVKWLVYDALFALVFPFLLPGFLMRMLRRGGYAARMGDRFALYPPDVVARFIPDGKPVCPHVDHQPSNRKLQTSDFVWIHAVSVGEVQVAGQLMRAWRAADPSVRFCFSTTSSTGWMMARKEVEKSGGGGERGDVLIYNPLDFPSFVKSALKLVRPRAIVLTESEIWPCFIRKAKGYGIPLFLINARVSDRSAPRYRMARFFFRDVFQCFTRIFAQSELDKARLVAAGTPAERVEVTGSFKFDVARRNLEKERELAEWIGESISRGGAEAQRGKILLGGSTWPGEDVALLKIYRKLLSSDASGFRVCGRPLLVLAPRHFEKADQVEVNIRAAGFDCVRRSRPVDAESFSRQNADKLPPVFLCDTTGEMMGLFGLCDVAFVGKSLCAHGSQNMIEPCLCGKPTVVGPYTENFRPVMSDLLESEAIVQVPDEASLEREIVRLMTDDAAAGALGARASAAVLKRQGVVPRCVAEIRRLIGEGIADRCHFSSGGKKLMKPNLMLICALTAVSGFDLLAMPTKDEDARAVPVVRKMLAPERAALSSGRKTRSEVADAAMGFVREAESEAAKLLLMKCALVLYVKDHKPEEAVETLKSIETAIADFSPHCVTNTLDLALRGLPEEDGVRLYRLLDESKIGWSRGQTTVDGRIWSYRALNGEAVIVAEKGGQFSCAVSPNPAGDIAIPSTLDGVKVTRVGRAAFCYYGGPRSVAIPEGVESIEWCAFYGCTNLTAVTLPSSLKSIGHGAFACCSGLTAVTIPAGVTNIEADAFLACSQLKSVKIPPRVASIGKLAFAQCESLASVSLLGEKPVSDDNIFSNCPELMVIHVSGNAKSWDRIQVWQDRPLVFDAKDE